MSLPLPPPAAVAPESLFEWRNETQQVRRTQSHTLTLHTRIKHSSETHTHTPLGSVSYRLVFRISCTHDGSSPFERLSLQHIPRSPRMGQGSPENGPSTWPREWVRRICPENGPTAWPREWVRRKKRLVVSLLTNKLTKGFMPTLKNKLKIKLTEIYYLQGKENEK